MTKEIFSIDGIQVPVITLNTCIIGTGAAGYNAALRLNNYGIDDIAIVTEGINTGTSRNTGSDKQTYYKLNLCGDSPDSITDMAEDLFRGKCVDGDLALVEAALSPQCYFNLVELGVPFPVNRYGEYVGYKTDHDPKARATSAGPLTSKLMTEALEQAVKRNSISIFDSCQVISIITENESAIGLLALIKTSGKEENQPSLVLFNCKNIIYATGGPAGIYADTVYPCGHNGASGIAFEAGVKGKNLTEWQYGLASLNPRWNVSGTYMQVLPRFVSIDENNNEHEFLNEFFKDEGTCLSRIFKKGYEWPFDSRKVKDGSSIIDLLVYREKIMRKRRVFLDFRSNPFGRTELDFSLLNEEAYDYLSKAGACFGTPLQRLLHMNTPAYELYLSKGVDLKNDMLEISLCAQHNNGGLDIDMWWQTNIKGLFAVGEVAGSHGIYRPGGSALNAGQVGSMRAAQYISMHGTEKPLPASLFWQTAMPKVMQHVKLIESIKANEYSCTELLKTVRDRMSAAASAIRSPKEIKSALDDTKHILNDFSKKAKITSVSQLSEVYKLRDILICQITYLSSMLDYINKGGKSRGSAIYHDEKGSPIAGLDENFRITLDNGELDDKIQETLYINGECSCIWRDVRNIPERDDVFENVWRDFRVNRNIY